MTNTIKRTCMNNGELPGAAIKSLKKAEVNKRAKRAWATRRRNERELDARIADAIARDDR